MTSQQPPGKWPYAAAVTSTALGAVLVGVGVVGGALAGLSIADAVNTFVVTNSAIAVSFLACGFVLGGRRPSNPIGWLFLADGLGHATTAAGVPLITMGLTGQWPTWLVRIITTGTAYSWPWSISLFLPLALLLFPDGRLPAAGWKWLVWVAVATAPLFAADVGSEPTSPVSGGPPGYLIIGDHERFAVLWRVAEVRVLLMYVVALTALAIRYRRGVERERRQLLWLILAAMLTVGVLIPWGLFLVGPVLLLLAIPLIAAAVTIAIVRYQLLDIRLVFSRALLYLVLAGSVVVVFEILVAVLDAVLRRHGGIGTSVLATVLVAVGFDPARKRLQDLLDRALNAARSVPTQSNTTDGLYGLVDALRSALRLPFVAVHGTSGEVYASGVAPQRLHVVPLANGTQRAGELLVGVHPGRSHLDPAEVLVLDLLAAPLSVAVYGLFEVRRGSGIRGRGGWLRSVCVGVGFRGFGSRRRCGRRV